MLGSIAAQAQPDHAGVSGTVLDTDGRPLEGVHVFIAGTMIGTVTDRHGRYRLERVPTGAHTLYVSMLGYEPARRDLLLRPRPYVIDVQLREHAVPLPEVVVTAERDRTWQRRLQRFERLFLGETENAAEVRIVNPEVLDFDATWWGRFTAQAHEPLVIENRALGYRVIYHLREFRADGSTIRYDGEPRFEPLEPASRAEAERWESNRQRAFHGSLRHFMLALLADACAEEGFVVELVPEADDAVRLRNRYPVEPHHLLRDGPTATESELRFPGSVEVTFLDEPVEHGYLRWMQGADARRGDPQRSWFRLTDGPTLVDHNGEVIDPYGVTVSGYFAFERVADLVPKEYRPSPARPPE